ncbi:MAG TPA: hypothetical protein V6D17_23390 [Candidatus Obscuribacterales bacterium]
MSELNETFQENPASNLQPPSTAAKIGGGLKNLVTNTIQTSARMMAPRYGYGMSPYGMGMSPYGMGMSPYGMGMPMMGGMGMPMMGGMGMPMMGGMGMPMGGGLLPGLLNGIRF